MSTTQVTSIDTVVFSNIYNILKSHADENKIPVFMKEDWKFIVDNFDRKQVIEVLAQYIIKEKPTFPERPIEYKNMEKCFSRLLERDILGLKVVHPSDDSNYDIKLKYDYDATQNNCLYMIQLGHEYNDISSYFQQDNRLRCNSAHGPSPAPSTGRVYLGSLRMRRLPCPFSCRAKHSMSRHRRTRREPTFSHPP